MSDAENPRDYYYDTEYPEPSDLVAEEDLLKSIAISLRKISENLYEIARNGIDVYNN